MQSRTKARHYRFFKKIVPFSIHFIKAQCIKIGMKHFIHVYPSQWFLNLLWEQTGDRYQAAPAWFGKNSRTTDLWLGLLDTLYTHVSGSGTFYQTKQVMTMRPHLLGLVIKFQEPLTLINLNKYQWLKLVNNYISKGFVYLHNQIQIISWKIKPLRRTNRWFDKSFKDSNSMWFTS
jgi:hypothetical protein